MAALRCSHSSSDDRESRREDGSGSGAGHAIKKEPGGACSECASFRRRKGPTPFRL